MSGVSSATISSFTGKTASDSLAFPRLPKSPNRTTVFRSPFSQFGFMPAAWPNTTSPVFVVNLKSVGPIVSVATGQLKTTGSPSSWSTFSPPTYAWERVDDTAADVRDDVAGSSPLAHVAPANQDPPA